MLRSSSTLHLARADYNMKTYGARAFAISVPDLWNQLPDDIRFGDIWQFLGQSLKTCIFLISLSRTSFYLNFSFSFFYNPMCIELLYYYALYKCFIIIIIIIIIIIKNVRE